VSTQSLKATRSDDEAQFGYSMSRVLTLSDGVFAIALTLLVISLRLGPEVTSAQLGQALRDLRPEIFAYLLSVFVIGAFWLAHRRAFAHIAAIDNGLLVLNLAVLAIVAVIPFPTDLVGRYGDEPTATIIYAAVIGVASLGNWSVFLYAQRRGLLEADTPADTARTIAVRSVAVCAAFLLSIPVAVWSPALAHYLWVAALPLRYVAAAVWGRRTMPR